MFDLENEGQVYVVDYSKWPVRRQITASTKVLRSIFRLLSFRDIHI